jgi:tetratricopeptide (TPR) repeat protein
VEYTTVNKKRFRINLPLALSLVCFIAVFMLSFEKIDDPDAWIHLSMGKTIVAERGIPDTEPFMYPLKGEPFVYSSWLFGVLVFLVHQLIGPAGLTIFKALIVSSTLLMVFHDTLRPHRNHVLAAMAVAVICTYAHERFALRPQIFSMLFLATSIFCLNAFLYERKKYLYILPLVHLLWANSHSSLNLMFVPFGAFLVGGIVQNFIHKRGWGSPHAPDKAQMITVLKVLFLSVAYALVSPYFTGQFLHASQFLDSSWYLTHIKELNPPTGARRTFIYVMDSIVVASFILNIRRIHIMHLLLVLPFLYMPFIAIRFVYFCAFIGAPVAARNIAEFLDQRQWSLKPSPALATALTAAILITPPVLARTGVPPFNIEYKKFGAGFNYWAMPKGAVEYLDSRNIYGRTLNNMSFGQYIIWTSYPKRTVYMDGRGHLPKELLGMYNTYRYAPDTLRELQARYGFEVIIMGQLTDEIAVKYNDFFFSDPSWALVYWDDRSMVYLKKGGRYERIITKDEYRYVKPDMHPRFFYERGISHKSYNSNLPLINELERAFQVTGAKKADVFLKVLDDRMSLEARPYFNRAIKAYKAGDHETALELYEKGLAIFPKNAGALTIAGFLQFNNRRYGKAREYFSRAIKNDANMANAYYGLGLLSKRYGNSIKSTSHFRKYLELAPDGEFAAKARAELKSWIP